MSLDSLRGALADRYTIERELGQGGMATVYLAQDLKHDRQVAIKVLKPELAAVLGADRFVQEIKTTAQLQHPNILPLFDSGSADGSLYYVMPYVEGETLRAKLDRETQLGVDDSVQMVREVADALQYAHDHGVVHRDIKPENILLHAGRPMVADFGIALAVSAAAGGRMTETGLSLGTPHYMSPEQATAERNITARSDIYSLGAVLYEMLTGEPPHTGTSAQQIIMRIVAEKPRSVSEARESVPPNVAAAVMTALQKLPADRFESAKAFAEALVNPAFTTTTTVGGAPATQPSRRSVVVVAAFAAIAIFATAFAAWGWLRPRSRGVEREAVEFYLDPPDTSTAFASFAISPDGRRLVADIITGDGHALDQRTLDARDWRAIPGTEGAGNPSLPIGKRPVFPFFSPDGRWVGYASRDGTLKRIPVDGGTAQTITPIPRGFWGASWAADNTIVFSASPSDTQPVTLFRVPANGGVPERLTVLDSMSGNHLFPCLSRDGAVLFFENAFPLTLMALSLGSGRVARLGTGISPLAARNGQLVYATPDGVIFSRTFNPRTLAFEGAPRRVVEGAGVIVVMASYAVSPGGTLVYETGSVGSRLVLVDWEGGTRAFGESFPVRHPRFSPSGDRVAFIGREGGLSERGGGDVWVYSFASGTAQLLSHEGPAVDPAWSSDGRYVGYSAPGNGQGRWKLFRRLADGTGSSQLLVSSKTDLYQIAFVPGDQEIVFYSGTDLFRFRIGRDSQPVPLFQTTATERQPTIAPDGHWLAYTSNETGTDEIYVRSYPDMGARTVVSVGGGSDPAWSASGSELFYWGHGHQIVAALRHDGGRLDVESRTELFPTAPFQPTINRNYDVRPDGREFVMVRGGASRAVVRLGALNGAPP